MTTPNSNLLSAPDDSDALLKTASLLQESKKFAESVKIYDQLIERASENALYYNQRGFLHYRLVEFALAINDFTSALKWDPSFHVAYYNRAEVCYRLARFDEAISDLDAAIKLHPDFNDAKMMRAAVLKDRQAALEEKQSTTPSQTLTRVTVLLHPKESRQKNSLRFIRAQKRKEFTFVIANSPEFRLHASNFTVLAVDAPPLSKSDANRPILLLDSTWRYVPILLKRLTGSPVLRSIPASYNLHSCSLRRSKLVPHPDGGLTSVEALFVTKLLLGERDDSLLDGFHWKSDFIEHLVSKGLLPKSQTAASAGDSKQNLAAIERPTVSVQSNSSMNATAGQVDAAETDADDVDLSSLSLDS